MTTHDDSTPPRGSGPEPADDEYSATVLASHWIQGPEPGETGTVRMQGPEPGETGTVRMQGPEPGETGTLRMQDGQPEKTVPEASGPGSGETGTVRIGGRGAQATVPAGDRSAGPAEAGSGETGTLRIQGPGPHATVPGALEGGPQPDRVEGTVLRFGPGVTAALAERTLRQVPVVAEPPAPRPRTGLRRYALPALVLLCVLAFLAWQRLGSSVEVRSVSVAARPAVLGCDTTSDIVARVTTDGSPGTLTYRWIRSDGTASGVLRETLARGQREARLHLRWTFEGEGHLTGQADLRLLTPTTHTVTAQVTYDCS
ncbi:hypothetical protein ACIQ6Y_00005 [Streptomyces sp. NPDC096205]|uniref:hypothetical protein n=1 Tax=Streptomyces sp. NPDC096205 TaxID=3366081 RepID=UPI0038276DA5